MPSNAMTAGEGTARQAGGDGQPADADGGRHTHGASLGVALRVLRIRRLLRHAGARAGHEQTVRVDAVRRAGDERGPVLPGADAQEGRVGRVDHADAVDPVGERGAADEDVEHVATAGFVEAGEQEAVGQPRVPGQHRVRALAADGQAGAVQVSRALPERVVGGAVADGQADAERRVGHGRHDVGQDGHVRAVGRAGEVGGAAGAGHGRAETGLSGAGEPGVVGARGLQVPPVGRRGRHMGGRGGGRLAGEPRPGRPLDGERPEGRADGQNGQQGGQEPQQAPSSGGRRGHHLIPGRHVGATPGRRRPAAGPPGRRAGPTGRVPSSECPTAAWP